MVHLVYCDDKTKVLEKILDGSKTMVVRGAAGRKIPHSRVNEGEILYFMQKGSKKISAKATVTHVENYQKLTEEEIITILAHNQPKLNLTDKQKERWHKKCLILIGFSNVENTSTESFVDRAFTTDAPTPWRPPDTLYPPPPNFPPA